MTEHGDLLTVAISLRNNASNHGFNVVLAYFLERKVPEFGLIFCVELTFLTRGCGLSLISTMVRNEDIEAGVEKVEGQGKVLGTDSSDSVTRLVLNKVHRRVPNSRYKHDRSAGRGCRVEFLVVSGDAPEGLFVAVERPRVEGGPLSFHVEFGSECGHTSRKSWIGSLICGVHNCARILYCEG